VNRFTVLRTYVIEALLYCASSLSLFLALPCSATALPSYPELKIPGLSAPIPAGAEFGYHPGGWGKPPVDEVSGAPGIRTVGVWGA